MDEMTLKFDQDKFVSITVLDDLGQPYTCEQWGQQGINGFPYVLDDGSSDYIYQLFYLIHIS